MLSHLNAGAEKPAYHWPAGTVRLWRTLSRRPLLSLAAGLALGIAPRHILTQGTALICLVLGLACLGASVWAWLRYQSMRCAALLLLGGAMLGMWKAQGLAALLAQDRDLHLPAARVEGTVAEDYGEKEESGRRALRLSDARVADLGTGPRAEKAWDGDLRVSYQPSASDAVWGPGDRVRLHGSLHSLGPPMNPGEFDYRAFMLGRGVTASVSLRKGLPIEIIRQGNTLSLTRLAWRARQHLTQGLKEQLSPRAADLARGMVLGDTGGLSARDMSVYSRTGLVHILSVSGLHLALALAIFLWLGKKAGLGRRSLAWMALFGAFFYAMICGMPVPCQRALYLFGLALLARALDLESDVVTSLAFGASVILLEQPGALFEAGCQLSFMVSLSLVTLTHKVSDALPEMWPEWLKLGIAGTAAAEFAAVPLVAWHFNVYSWPSLFASIACAPLMGPIVGLGLGTAALGRWLPLSQLLEWCLGILDWISIHFAALPYSAFSTSQPSALWLLLWPTLLFIKRPFAWALTFCGLVLWLLWGGLPWAHRHPGLTKTWFFAVGQGDASLTEFEDGRHLLVDAGPMHPDAGSWDLGPAFRSLGINGIDWAVVTHPHADHYGGMFWIFDQFKVSSLLHSGEETDARAWYALKNAAAAHGVAVINLAQSPPPKDWKGRISELSPLKPRLEGTRHDMHNNNVVLRVGDWMLLPGDMQAEGESRLLKAGKIRAVDLLKAGHHGSRTSSSAAWLKALKPRIVVIQCGPGNRYRHPSPATLEKLANIRLARTDLNGCLFVEHDARGTRLKAWKDASQAALLTAPPKQARSVWKKLQKQGRLPEPETDAEAE